MEPLVKIEDLSRRFHGRSVVERLNLSLERGEILGLLGPNGAGKSTSLRLLCGDLAPDSGRVLIAGVDLAQAPIQAKRQLGWLPDRPPLHLDQRVDEYLHDCALLHCLPRPEIRGRIERVKARCGLQGVGRRLIRNLSKGYRQRVGLAQAILHRPAVIVLDEPSDGLDPGQIRELRALIQQLAGQAAIILSSHILPEIQAVCQRVIILDQGRTVYAGPIQPPGRLQFKLGLQPPIDEAEVAGLAAVARVQRLHTDYFRVTLRDGANPAQLAGEVVSRGWGLLQMTPERPSLEQIFLDATSGIGP